LTADGQTVLVSSCKSGVKALYALAYLWLEARGEVPPAYRWKGGQP
jgi:hypothetical protein